MARYYARYSGINAGICHENNLYFILVNLCSSKQYGVKMGKHILGVVIGFGMLGTSVVGLITLILVANDVSVASPNDKATAFTIAISGCLFGLCLFIYSGRKIYEGKIK